MLNHFQFAERFYLNTIYCEWKSFMKAQGVDWKSTYFLEITH